MPDTLRIEYRLKSLRLLRQQMKARKLPTAYAIAKEAGLTTPAGRVGDARVRNITSGRRSTCDLVTATSICDALGVTLDMLFEVTEYHVSRTAAA